MTHLKSLFAVAAILSIVAIFTARIALCQESGVPLEHDEDSLTRLKEILKQPLSEKFTPDAGRGPLHDVLQGLARMHGFQLVLDEELLAAEDLKRAIDIPTHKTSLLNVFKWAVEPHQWTVIPRPDGLFLTLNGSESNDFDVRVYDLEPLIQDFRIRRVAMGVSQPEVLYFDSTIMCIERIVEPSKWSYAGGNNLIRPLDSPTTTKKLVIRCTHSMHDEIASLIHNLKQAKRSEVLGGTEKDGLEKSTTQMATSLGGTSDHPIRASLAEARDIPAFDKAPLGDAMQKLAEIFQIPCKFDCRFGVDADEQLRDAVVSSPAGKYTGKWLLSHWLKQCRARWQIRYDLLLVTTEDAGSSAEGAAETRVYPIADLFPTRVPTVPVEHYSDPGALPDVIEAMIEPQSWRTPGGIGSVMFHGESRSLVVFQSERVHEQIVNLVKRFRESKSSRPGDVRKSRIPEGLLMAEFTTESPQVAIELVKVIPLLTTSKSWSVNGGKGTLCAVGNKVIVQQEYEGLQEVGHVMSELFGYVAQVSPIVFRGSSAPE